MIGDPVDNRDGIGRPSLQLDICKWRLQASAGVLVRITIPGRTGEVTRHWGSPSGRLDEHQVEDLNSWILTAVQNSLMELDGVQGVLPLV